MKRSHEILKSAVKRQGAKKVAILLNVSPSLIYKWCEDAQELEGRVVASGTVNPLERIKMFYEATQEDEILHWICQQADGYFVKNPKQGEGDCEKNILGNIKKFIKEFSETLDIISDSYGNDQKISSEEARAIRRQWEDLKRIGEGFVNACELGKFAKIKVKNQRAEDK